MSPLYNRVFLETRFPNTHSLHPPLVLPLGVQRGGTNHNVTYEGANCPSSWLPPDLTKPDRSCLAATADVLGSTRPTVVAAHPPGS